MAVAAAELALQLLADVLKTKRGPEVGIGLGPGRATLDFCRTFSSLLAGYSEPVKLKLVAISAGCQTSVSWRTSCGLRAKRTST